MRRSAFASASRTNDFDNIKNFEDFMNEVDSDDDSPKKAVTKSSLSNSIPAKQHNFKGNTISTLKTNNASHNLPSHLFNSIKSVASDYNEFTSKELMSKSGSDTHEFDKYKPSMGFGNQNSTGGYNTLKSTLKSTTISSIPEAEEADTTTSEEARVYKRLDDLGYDDSDLEIEGHSSELSTSQEEYPVITTGKNFNSEQAIKTAPQPLYRSIATNRDIDLKTNVNTKAISETKSINCQTSGDFMKDFQDKENLIKVLKKELEIKDQQILSLRTEMEVEQRKKWNVADESTQTISNTTEKSSQVNIEDGEKEHLQITIQKFKHRIQELEADIIERQDEVDQLNNKIKNLKADILNAQHDESSNVILQKQINKLSKQLFELQTENTMLNEELRKHEEIMNYTQSDIDHSSLQQTTKTADMEFENLKKQHETNDKFLKEYQKQNEKLTRENKELGSELKNVRGELDDLKRKRALNEKEKDEIHTLHRKIRELEEIIHSERVEFDRKEEYLKNQIQKVKHSKEELEVNLKKLDPQKLEEQRMFILSFEEKSKILEQQHNEKMMELCRRLKIQQDLQDQYDQQTTTIQQQERLINNLKHKIREIETSLFDTESRIREKERENRELRSENSDLWREKKDISKTRDKILELEQEIRIRDEKINAFPRDIEKQKIEYENNIQEAEIRVKKLEFMKDKEHESKMKEIKEYYLKKQKELNDTVKELSRGKSLISNKKKSKNIAQDSDNDFLKDELFAKQATIEELMKKITEIESRNEGKELSNNETSVIREGNINEESELIGELRIVRLEKEELLRKLELSEMNKVFIKENAMEQVKAAYSELNTTREKYRNEIQNLEERHNQEMKCQESHFLQEIEDYKNIIDNSATKQTHTLQLINENSGENSRILMLKQLISRIENLESKHKIKEMELERELNETRYRYELKITSMKQHLDLTVQQKNQQVLQLKTSLDNLVQAFQKLKIAQRENLF